MGNYADIDLDRNTRKQIYFGKPCVNFTLGEQCDECGQAIKFFQAANRENDPAEKAILKDKGRLLMAKSKIFINAINVKAVEDGFPNKIYVLPPTVYDDIVEQAKGLKRMNENINPFNPNDGCTIMITREGQGIQTRYRVQIDQNTKPLPRMDALEQMYNLDDIENLLINAQSAFYILENGPNLLRILPPWTKEKRVLYKEMKFHRFPLSYVMEGENERNGIQQQQSTVADPFSSSSGSVAKDVNKVDDFFESLERDSSSPRPTRTNPDADIPDFPMPGQGEDSTDAQIAELLKHAEVAED